MALSDRDREHAPGQWHGLKAHLPTLDGLKGSVRWLFGERLKRHPKTQDGPRRSVRERLDKMLRWESLPLPTWIVQGLQRTAKQARGDVLLQAVPTLLALVVLGVMVLTPAPVAARLAGPYRSAARDASRCSDWPDARLHWQRVRELAPDDVEAKLGLAHALDGLGERPAAGRLMTSLAPVPEVDPRTGQLQATEQRGVAEAHLWVVERMIEGGELSAPQVQHVVRHLRAVLAQIGDHPRASQLMARYLSRAGRHGQASAMLAQAAERTPRLHLELARSLAAQQQTVSTRDPEAASALGARVKAHAELAETVHRVAIDQGTALLARARAFLAESLTSHAPRREGIADLPTVLARRLADRIAAGEAAVDEAWARIAITQLVQKKYAEALESVGRIAALEARARMQASVHITWSVACRRNEQPAETVRHLIAALELQPQQHAALMPALISATAPHPGPLTRAVLADLDRLADRLPPVSTSMARGTIALLQDDLETARKHLEAAYRPGQSPGITNNLAWCLAHTVNPDLTRALALVDEALRISPDDASYRDTRGVVLCLMGRWNQALPDLQASREKTRDPERVLRLMAECYERQGLTTLAHEHRREADAIKARGAAKPDGPKKTPGQTPDGTSGN